MPARRGGGGRGGRRGGGGGGGGGRGGRGGMGDEPVQWGGDRSGNGWQQAGSPEPTRSADEIPPCPESGPVIGPDGCDYGEDVPLPVRQALHALWHNGVDAATRPIMQKWVEQLQLSKKLMTPMPNPPNWRPHASQPGAASAPSGAVSQPPAPGGLAGSWNTTPVVPEPAPVQQPPRQQQRRNQQWGGRKGGGEDQALTENLRMLSETLLQGQHQFVYAQQQVVSSQQQLSQELAQRMQVVDKTIVELAAALDRLDGGRDLAAMASVLQRPAMPAAAHVVPQGIAMPVADPAQPQAPGRGAGLQMQAVAAVPAAQRWEGGGAGGAQGNLSDLLMMKRK